MKSMKHLSIIFLLFLGQGSLFAGEKPNIILLFSDDAGYADFGFQGSKEMKTPHLDQLAADGVRFTQGYVTASVCGPSRAGLLTGKYQQRFGFEENNVPGYMSEFSALQGEDMGLSLDETTMADHMKSLGYVTAFFGKWHLGGADRYHPTLRGFDEFYGFRGGARSYYSYGDSPPSQMRQLERGFGDYAEHEGYLTDVLAHEVVQFMERKSEQAFFIILSFNAVHTPMEAREEDLKEFPQLSGTRQTLAAMNLAMDRACGEVLEKVDELGLKDNTLVVFANDNGGPSDRNASINRPLSGTKSNHLEGGIRIPFLMRWPGKISKDQVYEFPISTLDLLPTFIEAGGGKADTIPELDGVDLMPYLLGENLERPHQKLFWKKESRAAIREGDWKLIRFTDRPPELYFLPEDISEHNNLAASQPDRVTAMFKQLYEWEMTLERPRWLLKRQYEKYDNERMDQFR